MVFGAWRTLRKGKCVRHIVAWFAYWSCKCSSDEAVFVHGSEKVSCRVLWVSAPLSRTVG